MQNPNDALSNQLNIIHAKFKEITPKIIENIEHLGMDGNPMTTKLMQILEMHSEIINNLDDLDGDDFILKKLGEASYELQSQLNQFYPLLPSEKQQQFKSYANEYNSIYRQAVAINQQLKADEEVEKLKKQYEIVLNFTKSNIIEGLGLVNDVVINDFNDSYHTLIKYQHYLKKDDFTGLKQAYSDLANNICKSEIDERLGRWQRRFDHLQKKTDEGSFDNHSFDDLHQLLSDLSRYSQISKYYVYFDQNKDLIDDAVNNCKSLAQQIIQLEINKYINYANVTIKDVRDIEILPTMKTDQNAAKQISNKFDRLDKLKHDKEFIDRHITFYKNHLSNINNKADEKFIKDSSTKINEVLLMTTIDCIPKLIGHITPRDKRALTNFHITIDYLCKKYPECQNELAHLLKEKLSTYKNVGHNENKTFQAIALWQGLNIITKYSPKESVNQNQQLTEPSPNQRPPRPR